MATALQAAVRNTTRENHPRVARVGVEPTESPGLSRVALPVCVPCHLFTSAPPAGFEPATSTVTEWRALQAAPRRRDRWLRSLGCPPFLGPPQMGDYAENLHANRLTYVCTLIDPFLVTGRAELFRRRVLQRAMRPDGVVFPAVPCRLFPSVRHA